MGKNSTTYTPFYPTALGTKHHDITLRQLPAYSMGAKPEIKTKFNSPGPGAYPKEDKQSRNSPKSLYPEDKAHKYSLCDKRKEIQKHQSPGPATYPIDIGNPGPYEILSIYAKENANKFSIGERREQKMLQRSPGPAIYPRDAKNLNPADKANRFTICDRRIEKKVPMSPGPAQYPCRKKVPKNQVATIYPADTRLLPTMKIRYDSKNKNQVPPPNAYPMLEEEGIRNAKSLKADLTQKMIPGKRSPVYSLGVKHSPKQHILILKDDQY